MFACSGDWCQWSAYIAMISVTSTYISAAWVAYATFKCVHTHRRRHEAEGIVPTGSAEGHAVSGALLVGAVRRRCRAVFSDASLCPHVPVCSLTERRPLTTKGIALAYATSLGVSCVMASLISGPTLGRTHRTCQGHTAILR